MGAGTHEPQAEVRRKVLFLCRNNSCRSQMAEGLLNYLAHDRFEAYSAGAEPTAVHPLAVEVMGEIGIDISRARSKGTSMFEGWEFEFVVTVCKEGACPFFAGPVRTSLAWSFDDPAAAVGSDAEVLEAFRRVRDEIRSALERFIEECSAQP